MAAQDKVEKNLHKDCLIEKQIEWEIARTFKMAVVLLHCVDRGTVETSVISSVSIHWRLLNSCLLLDFLCLCSSSDLLSKTL